MCSDTSIGRIDIKSAFKYKRQRFATKFRYIMLVAD